MQRFYRGRGGGKRQKWRRGAADGRERDGILSGGIMAKDVRFACSVAAQDHDGVGL
jgi:hypothetical protein